MGLSLAARRFCARVPGAVAVFAAFVFATAPAASPATCIATASEPPNDSYRPGAPVRTTMGKGHVLFGVVRSAAGCRPIARARLEFFQSGPRGYSVAPSWANRATVVTGADGTYRLQGAYPSSTGPPPHIHMRISAPGFVPVTTTYFPGPTAKRSRLVLVLEPAPG
jgi:protocatechuate 3,4-dioxygenase beta subunit